MSAKDPIKVSPQQLLEGDSLPEIERALRPWLIQWAQEGKDYTRDGFVQVVDRSESGAIVSPLTFSIQAKSQQQALADSATVAIETRHLEHWNRGGSTVLLALWGAGDRRVAFRTIRQVVAEVTNTNGNWKDQTSVSVHFRPEHVMAGDEALKRIRHWVADEADAVGGLKQFHRTRRRVLLTQLYYGTTTTSQTLTAAAPGEKDEHITLGPGWNQRELDPADVYAPRLLSGALLLFEEVVLPVGFLEVVARLLGCELLLSLLESGHLVPLATESLLGFRQRGVEVRGVPVVIRPQKNQGPFVRELAKELLAGISGVNPKLIDAIHRVTRVIPDDVSGRVLKESENDLAKAGLRDLLGLSPHRGAGTSEPIWDAPLVNRLLLVNVALATAEELAIDVVEYEAGLSRLASEKWFTELRFNRLFSSGDHFDAVLRAAGVPDLGLLEGVIGLPAITKLSMTDEAQEFRDWFWSSLYGLTEGRPTDEASTRSRLERLVGQDLRALRLPCELKLRFFEQFRSDYIVGSHSRRLGYASRSDRGSAVLRRQAEVQSKRRLELLGKLGMPPPYSACLCGSGAKFRFCCGTHR